VDACLAHSKLVLVTLAFPWALESSCGTPQYGPQVYDSVRVIRIDNTGPVVTMAISPPYAPPYVMDNFNPSTVTVAYVSGPAITSVTFLKGLSTTTTLIGRCGIMWVASMSSVEDVDAECGPSPANAV
jgi:hypothetical protein